MPNGTGTVVYSNPNFGAGQDGISQHLHIKLKMNSNNKK